MEKKITVIIQARMGSTRLPGKVLMKVLDKTVLEYVIERCSFARCVKSVVVATTDGPEDDPIAGLLASRRIAVFRGSRDDVLDRYYQAAAGAGAEHIARITADCPLIDPAVIDRAGEMYAESGADYCANILKRTYPDGEDVELFSLRALEKAWKEAALASEREHVTPFIRKHTELFRCVNFEYPRDISAKRWTLDRTEDFGLIKAVLEALYPANPAFSMEDAVDFLSKHPDIEKMNSHIVPGEGYAKSLREDRRIKP